MASPMFYLVSPGGGAKTNSPRGAAALRAVGMRECTRDEYRKHMRRVAQDEAREAKRAASLTGMEKVRHDAEELAKQLGVPYYG